MLTNNENVVLDVILQEEELSNGCKVFVACCEDLDIASQGNTLEEAQENFFEAISLWLEVASPNEVASKLSLARQHEPFIKRMSIQFGQTPRALWA